MKNLDPYSQALKILTRTLAISDQSHFELRRKLGLRFEPEIVEAVIQRAQDQGWLKSDQEIAVHAAEALARRYKSHAFIEQKLTQRQLPTPPLDPQSEAAKIRALVEKKFGSCKLTDEVRAKAQRFLLNQGFEDHQIGTVLE